MRFFTRGRGPLTRACLIVLASALLAGLSAGPFSAQAAGIRISATNPVPACVTPERLMAFLRARNTTLDPKYRDIAHWYKRHGEELRVRWDYAFFQMLIETNYLTFRRGDGRRGDVDPRQNNFAGLGTTGGGVPGDSFPDVATGVRGQLEHLVVYSGEQLPAPVAPRTRLKQNDILSWTAPLSKRRAVTLQDLAGKWAADRAYGRSIESIAERFRQAHCTGQMIAAANPQARTPAPQQRWGSNAAPPARTAAAPAPQPAAALRASVMPTFPTSPQPKAAAPTTCRVLMASYGGKKTMLIRHQTSDAIEYTALRVLDGFEQSMMESYLKTHAPGGTLIGEFASSEGAFERAFQLCPGAQRG